MRLKLRRFLTEGAFDAFAQLKLRAGLRSLEIGEALPSEIFQFRDKRPQLFDALGKVVDRKGL